MKRITDNHCPEPERYERQGFPEAIYCPGKTIKDICDIADKLLKGSGPVIATKADKDIFNKIKRYFPKARYHAIAKIIIFRGLDPNIKKSIKQGYVCVVTAGTSDIPIAEEASTIAELLGTKVLKIYDIGVSGIHRVLKYREKLYRASCIVICAGMEGALASVIGGIVKCPVIGVPTSIGYGASFGGVSALLTMLNSCAPNVSVVNINDGFGAGVIAHLINQNQEG